MTSSLILSIITFVYGLAAFLYVAAMVFKKPVAAKMAFYAALIGLIGNTGGIALRWIESYQQGIGHAPLSNLYESLVFFAWTTILIYLVIERRFGSAALGAFVTPLAFLAMAYASSPKVSDSIQPLIPALKSNWLIAHVMTCFIGYAAFAIALGISVMYLMKQTQPESQNGLLSRLPQVRILDDLNHQMVMFGFLFLTIGIITGAVWANSAWGRYWGWDPKETWSFITWLIYAAVLHCRFVLNWRGKIFAYFAIIGFMAVLFTYFGVNYLPGLHSYGALS